jgi:hypothetical protein
MRQTLLGLFVVVVLLLHLLACGSLAQRRGVAKPVAAESQCPQYHLVLREYEIVLNASIREQLARQADDGKDDDVPLRPRRGMRGPPPDRGAERRRREKSLTDAMEQRVQERVQALRRSRAKQADEKSGCGGSNSLLCFVLEHWSSILAWGGGVTALLVLAELVLASAFPVTASRATEELVDAALGRRGVQSSVSLRGAPRSPAHISASPAAPYLDLAPEAPLGDFVNALRRSVSPSPVNTDAVAPPATATASSPPIRHESPQQQRAVTLTPERREELGLLMDLLLRMHGGRHLAELRLLKWSMTLYAVAWAVYTFVEVPSLVKAAVTGFGAVTLFLPGGFSTVLATAVNSMMSVMNIVWTSLCVPCIRNAWTTSDKARERWGVARELLRSDLQRDVAPMAAQLQQRLEAGQEPQQRRSRSLTA